MTTILIALQLVVALGIMNVWILRRGRATPYRGGNAGNLREEFAAYGLPPFAFYAVGALKVLAAVVLIAGVGMSAPVRPAAMVVLALMLGAIAMHVKVGDPIVKSVPAILMLAMSTGIVLLR